MNITQKLFAYLLLACVIPLAFLGVMSYSKSKDILKKEIDKSLLMMVDEKKKHLEIIMDEVESLIANLSSIEDIKDVLANETAEVSDYERLGTQAKIGYILSGFTSLKGLVSIDIYSLNGAHYHVGDTLDVQEIDSAAMKKLYEEALNSNNTVLWQGIENNINIKSRNSKVIVVTKVLKKVDMTAMTDRPIGLLIINYDTEVFYDHFHRENTDGLNYSNDADYIILDRNHRIVYHPDKTLIGSIMDEEILDSLKGSIGSFNMQVGGENQLIIYDNSNKNSWTLMALIKEKTITGKVYDIAKNTVLLLVFSFLLLLVFALIISRIFVEPIKNITNSFKEIQKGTID
ncbi:MAG: hybrid sensor histidine kinase/response regulator, partial [Clostridiales bacterium]|nr:hybrid sensor histidine kinase/response regulator [Clostridiales bacterium]